MKNKLSNILLILILVAGLSLLVYPSLSDYWNSFTQSKVIVDYTKQIENLDTEKYDRILQEAYAYNESLIDRRNQYLLSEEQKAEYNELLNVSGIGIMGYIEIPAISVTLPVYHGTDDSVLQIAIGHLEWTSLPVGGESTHCVLSGHRGLPSAKLFSDLDKLVVGDVFVLRVLDEVLTYEVDQIHIVEPHETESLLIEEGKDYCTLVTCTPYGINTHRILVRGYRIENAAEAKNIRLTSEAAQIDPLIIAPIVAAPILIVLFIMLMIPKNNKKPSGGEKIEE
ncbi:MAG: class C sortase [Oscillospiraceae bacterium]|nr:class C sortase [Oscillospiraceae bacterium]